MRLSSKKKEVDTASERIELQTNRILALEQSESDNNSLLAMKDSQITILNAKLSEKDKTVEKLNKDIENWDQKLKTKEYQITKLQDKERKSAAAETKVLSFIETD